MTTKFISRPYRISRDDTQAMLIDVQKRLAPHILDHEAVTQKIGILIQGLQALNVPIMLNEQYKKGLGDTLPEVMALLEKSNAMQSFEKTSFSACDNPTSWNHLAQQNRNTVLLFGMETHVCVMQTALDLLDNGMQPVIIADASGSRSAYDKKLAIRRMRRAGAVVTTVEAILFELCRDSQDPAFKTISALVK